MKKILVVFLALCLLPGILAGCGKKKDSSSSAAPSAAASSAPEASTPALSAPTPSPTPARTAKAAKINADGGLNIRDKASTDGEIVGLAENGSLLPLLVETPADGWYQVEYEGKSAYIFAEYAQVVEITLEEYNRLKTGASPAASAAPADSDDPGSAASSSSSATEDGE